MRPAAASLNHSVSTGSSCHSVQCLLSRDLLTEDKTWSRKTIVSRCRVGAVSASCCGIAAVAWKRHRPEQTFHPSVPLSWPLSNCQAGTGQMFKKQYDTVCKEIASKGKDWAVPREICCSFCPGSGTCTRSGIPAPHGLAPVVPTAFFPLVMSQL